MNAWIPLAVFVITVGVGGAAAQEVRLATFQELAQVIVDTESGEMSASVTLQSTSNQEIRFSTHAESAILDDGRIVSVIFTNEDECVLGVYGESCIMINVQRGKDWEGINETQDEVKLIGDALINAVNEALDTDAAYHSVFLHHRDEANVALGTSGAVSGRNTVSAVYTMPMESTDSMFAKLSGMLLAGQIREAGGFYDLASTLASREGARTTFSVIAEGADLLYQLKVTAYGTYPGGPIMPLDLYDTDSVSRSTYFDEGFYPLNSLIQAVILGNGTVTDARPGFVETQVRDAQIIPADLHQTGWIDGMAQGRVEMIFLFGDETSVQSDELSLLLGDHTSKNPIREGPVQDDWSAHLILGLILAAAIGAAVYFMRGYKSDK